MRLTCSLVGRFGTLFSVGRNNRPWEVLRAVFGLRCWRAAFLSEKSPPDTAKRPRYENVAPMLQKQAPF